MSVLPTVAGRAGESAGSSRAIESVGVDLGGRVVAVPKVLEGFERLSGEIFGIEVVKVIRIAASIGPGPSVALESALPVAVGASVNGATSFVIRLSRLGSETDIALSFGVPLIKEVLLSGASIGRVQRDVIVLAFRSVKERSRCTSL